MSGEQKMNMFEPAAIGGVVLKNRIIRSATYEGRCNEAGFPDRSYRDLYVELARHGVGAMITGFAFIAAAGRAMQPRQAGIEDESKLAGFREVTRAVHHYDSRIFMQLAHAGRQTSSLAAGGEVLGASRRRSRYFKARPRSLETEEVFHVVEQFAAAAARAQRAGFDGVQLHAAHGYLIHQFLSPAVNNRGDMFGIDPRWQLGTRFLELIIERTRQRCGSRFPILVKISGQDDVHNGISEARLAGLIRFLDSKAIDAIEISCGTMDRALNIFRGKSFPLEAILRCNPRYRREPGIRRFIWRTFAAPLVLAGTRPFTPTYNLRFAALARRHTAIPIISVGGFRTGREIESALETGKTDFVGLCRPLLCEPDFVERLEEGSASVSRCISCNLCAVLCDTRNPTRCHLGEANNEY
jgi:2,4-dienoyl-CoA reductase-like NADH-dependent reductase (Old Yellow Enzyme family)